MTDTLRSTPSTPAAVENQAAEARLLSALAAEVGINLARLHFLTEISEAEARRVIPWASTVVEAEPNAAARYTLYSFILKFASLDAGLVNLALNLLPRELDADCRRSIEVILIRAKRKEILAELARWQLDHPSLVSLEGLIHLGNAARRDAALLAEVRQVFDSGEFDLEALSVLANLHEPIYNLIAQAPPFGNRRLTGRECTAIFRAQIPTREYYFRRAGLVPYLGVVSGLKEIPDLGESQEQAITLARQSGFPCLPGEVLDVSGAKLVDLVALPMAIRAFEGSGREEVRGVVLLRRERSGIHAKRSQFFVCLLTAPTPREGNLLPKRILPEDDPIRLVIPEA